MRTIIILTFIFLLLSCQSHESEIIDTWEITPTFTHYPEGKLWSAIFYVKFNKDNTILDSDGQTGKWTKKGEYYYATIDHEPTIEHKLYIKNKKLYITGSDRVYVRSSDLLSDRNKLNAE